MEKMDSQELRRVFARYFKAKNLLYETFDGTGPDFVTLEWGAKRAVKVKETDLSLEGLEGALLDYEFEMGYSRLGVALDISSLNLHLLSSLYALEGLVEWRILGSRRKVRMYLVAQDQDAYYVKEYQSVEELFEDSMARIHEKHVIHAEGKDAAKSIVDDILKNLDFKLQQFLGAGLRATSGRLRKTAS